MKTTMIIKRAALPLIISGMAAVNVFAQSGTLVWSGGAADGQWSGANWQLIGGGGDIAYINDAPLTFSGSFNGSNKTVTPLDSTQLKYGQPISSNLLQWGFDFIKSELATGTYNLGLPGKNWNVTTGTGSAIANSGVIALFNAHTGAVTVNGAQYLLELRFDNNANTVLNTNSGTLFFSPNDNGVAITASGNSSAEIKTDIDNRFLSFNSSIAIRNNGSGTLAFTGNEMHAKGGFNFNNNAGANVTAFNNVTLDNNGAHLYFKRGTFDFNGVTQTVSTNQVILGDEGNTTLNINANSLLDLTNSSYLVMGKNTTAATTAVTINIKGELKSGNNNVCIADDNAAVTSIISLSGTGKLTARTDLNNHTIYVGNSPIGTGKLLVGEVGADTAVVTARRIEVSSKAGAGYMNVAGSSTVALSGYYAALAISSSSGYGEANFSDNSVLTTQYIDMATSTGTGVLNLSDNAQVTVTTKLSVATAAGGQGIVNLRGNSSLNATNSGQSVSLGKLGNAVVNVYDTAYLSTVHDLIVGDGGGRAVVSIYSGTVAALSTASHGYLFINNANNVDGSSGIVNLSGGVLEANTIVFGNASATVGTGTAHLNITGGELILQNNNGLHTGAYNANAEARADHTASDTQINLGGGKITTTNGLISNMNMTLTGSGGNIKFNATADKTIQLGGNLTGSGGLEVAAGTLLLKGAANAYDGQTVVDIGASLTLDAAASLSISLSALEADGNRFAFDGGGYLTLYGTVNLDFTGASGTEWKLINPTLIADPSDNWLAGFTKDSAEDIWTKDDYTFRLDTGILTIPEPSTWTLLLTGAALLAVLRRRK